MRLALTVWNGRIAPLFDTASTVRLIDVEAGAVSEVMDSSVPSGGGMMNRISFLSGNSVDILICGAVSRQVHRMLLFSGVKVLAFTSGSTAEVIEAFLTGSLDDESFRMPGCGAGRCRGGAGRGADLNRLGRNRGSTSAEKRGAECQVEMEQDLSEQAQED